MLKPIDINDIPAADTRRNGNTKKDIEEFISSGKPAAEIVIPSNRTIASVYSSYAVAIKRNSYPVTAVRRGERAFLIKGGKNA